MNTKTESFPALKALKKTLQNRLLNVFIKVILCCLFSYAIYQQVFAKDNVDELMQSFWNCFKFSNGIYLFLVVFLTPINWGMETLKWQQLIQHFSKLNFWQTYRAILAGVTFSLFTPNRIGEYGGRILMVAPANNWKAVIASLVGSFSQLLIILSFGLMGLMYFASRFLVEDMAYFKLLLPLGMLCIGGMAFAFFNIEKVVPFAQKLPFYSKLKAWFRHLHVLRLYTSQQLFTTLSLAFVRYLIYSLQYIFILYFFEIEVPFFVALAAISSIFLFQTSFPLPPLMGLFARGEVALYVWGFFSTNDVNILAATYSLFILNLSIPALLGMIFIVKINVLKSLGYEK